jgi:hypothetical protein
LYSENDLIKMARQFKSDYEPKINASKRRELVTVTGVIHLGDRASSSSIKPSSKVTIEDRHSSLEAVH